MEKEEISRAIEDLKIIAQMQKNSFENNKRKENNK